MLKFFYPKFAGGENILLKEGLIMANKFNPRIPFCFETKSKRLAASKEVDKAFPMLRTSECKQEIYGQYFYVLFIEETRSFLYDSQVESLMRKYGGVRRDILKDKLSY